VTVFSWLARLFGRRKQASRPLARHTPYITETWPLRRPLKPKAPVTPDLAEVHLRLVRAIRALPLRRPLKPMRPQPEAPAKPVAPAPRITGLAELPSTFVAIDLETTGLNDDDRIVSLTKREASTPPTMPRRAALSRPVRRRTRTLCGLASPTCLAYPSRICG